MTTETDAEIARLRAEVERLKAENVRLTNEFSATSDDLALCVTTVEHMTAALERSWRRHAPAIGTYSACTDCGRCGHDVGGPCACDGSAGEGGVHAEAEG